MDNNLHWDPVAQRMRPGLAIYKTDLQNRIAAIEKMIPTLTDPRLVDAARDQIASQQRLLASLAHIDSSA